MASSHVLHLAMIGSKRKLRDGYILLNFETRIGALMNIFLMVTND
jgi:hypothetical protein